MLTSQAILIFLKENKETFRYRFGVRRIAIFGSYARGDQNEQSDIDILIDMLPETENIFDKRLELRELIKDHFAKNVDICHEQALKPIFKDSVLQEAIYA